MEGIDELYDHIKALGLTPAPGQGSRAGLHPSAPLADQAWGTREFGVLDPDGNGITFFEQP